MDGSDAIVHRVRGDRTTIGNARLLLGILHGFCGVPLRSPIGTAQLCSMTARDKHNLLGKQTNSPFDAFAHASGQNVSEGLLDGVRDDFKDRVEKGLGDGRDSRLARASIRVVQCPLRSGTGGIFEFSLRRIGQIEPVNPFGQGCYPPNRIVRVPALVLCSQSHGKQRLSDSLYRWAVYERRGAWRLPFLLRARSCGPF